MQSKSTQEKGLPKGGATEAYPKLQQIVGSFQLNMKQVRAAFS